MELQIVINGVSVAGLLQASLATSNCFSSDSYSLTFAMGPFPLRNIAFWSTLSLAYVEINVIGGYTSISQSLMTGMIDVVHVNPLTGVVAVEGRDLSSSLIDSYRQQDFVNQTASEVASIIASYHGLRPVVTNTSGNVGRYYGDGSTRLALGQFSRLRSDWDLVVQLARENDFDTFVEGTSLFFQPSNLSNNVPIRIPFCDIRTIKFEQTLTIVPNSTARVQSWNCQNMASYVSDADEEDQVSSGRKSQPFLFPASNFTSQQVTDAAGRYANELSRLGTMLHIEMPWNLAISPRSVILVDETSSAFDKTYRVDHIERHYSTTSGSSQVIRAIVA